MSINFKNSFSVSYKVNCASNNLHLSVANLTLALVGASPSEAQSHLALRTRVCLSRHLYFLMLKIKIPIFTKLQAMFQLLGVYSFPGGYLQHATPQPKFLFFSDWYLWTNHPMFALLALTLNGLQIVYLFFLATTCTITLQKLMQHFETYFISAPSEAINMATFSTNTRAILQPP